jgi:CO/xanthine dehydrogenase FAD-binding subunit
VRNSDRCHSVFQADVACALVALNAKVKLVEESGERTLPLVEFYTGKGKSPNRLNPTEILAGIWVPPPKVHRLERYEKFSLRAALDFPQVGVAAVIGYDLDGKIKEGNIVINAVSSSPLELKSAGNLLMGKRLDEALIEKTARLAYEASHPVNNTDFPTGKMVVGFSQAHLRGFSR